ncbi:kinase-like domain-containing protein [Nemania diffusa]|nr:kinase-like domain-containing protein [Nemania diffusa]
MERNTVQPPEDDKQAIGALSMHDVTQDESRIEEPPLDSSRFIISSSERLDTLKPEHPIPGPDGQKYVSQPPRKPQHLSVITRVDGHRLGFERRSDPSSGYDGSDPGYQTSSNGKSPSSSTTVTFTTTKTSPLLSVAHSKGDEDLVTSDLELLDHESQQADKETTARDATASSLRTSTGFKPIRRWASRTFPLTSRDSPSKVTGFNDSNQTKREDQASDLQGFGEWTSNSSHEKPPIERNGLPLPDRDLYDTITSGLRAQLYDSLVPFDENSNLGFIPNNKLYELVNREAILKELKTALPNKSNQEIQRHADDVCPTVQIQEDRNEYTTSVRKLFAILVLAGKTDTLPALISEGLIDDDLPLQKNGKHKLACKTKSPAGEDLIRPLSCFNSWEPDKIGDFLHYQWWFLAPIFEEGEYNLVKHYVIARRSQLPFITSNDAGKGHKPDNGDDSGGGGMVTMVDIHPHHHTFSDESLSKRGFAIKALHKPNREAFERERSILSKFKGHNQHENIVILLATYELANETGHKFNMIFYRADGNLYGYWKEANPCPEFNYETLLWGSGQCKGIAHGLLKLHDHTTWPSIPPGRDEQEAKEIGKISQMGRHGDIKPENILYYPRRGSAKPVLKICDFGVSELRFRMTRSTRDDPITYTYRAPECDMVGKSPGRPADMWSLGCVYLEFVAWFLGGISLVNEFTRSRISPDMGSRYKFNTDAFFDCDPAGVRKVKDAVTKSIEYFHLHPRCTQYLHEFLKLIEEEMLVIDPESRVSCSGLYKRLNDMFKECEKSEEYTTKAVPRQEDSVGALPQGGFAKKKLNHGGSSHLPRGLSEYTKSKPIPQWEYRPTFKREESQTS